MRVLLVQPSYSYPNAHALRTELLGLSYLAATLGRDGHEVSLFDPTLNPPRKASPGGYFYGASHEEIAHQLRRIAPDAVGVSCHNEYSVPGSHAVARLAKGVDSRIITVAGGLHVSVHKSRILEEERAFDYALIGEADFTFPRLLRELGSRAPDLSRIDGLVYRKDGEIRENPKQGFIDDVDRIPFPARDRVDIRRYMHQNAVLYGLGTRPALSLLTSRSCPNRCTFCNMWLVHGARWRPRSPENVLGEIDEIVNRYGAKHVFIMDDNFAYDPCRAKAICEGIIRKGYRFRWNTPNGISVKGIDRELAVLMKRAGCANVCVGIESGSEYIRNREMRKRISNGEIARAIDCFSAAGIPVGGFLLLGMPGEDAARFAETVEFARKLPLSFINVSFVTPFPGTKLYARLLEEKRIGPDFRLVEDTENRPAFATPDFDFDTLRKRRLKLLLLFYLSHMHRIFFDLVRGRLNWLSRVSVKMFFLENVVGAFKKEEQRFHRP